ncbi:MAG: hypothetical protein ABIR84_02735, partial [Candidatus Nitrotoga sp.]
MAALKISSAANKATATFCWGIALGIGFAGASLLLIVDGVGMTSIVSAVVLVGLSAALGEWGARHHRTLLRLAVANEMVNAKAI